jgi:hypothetical protein
LTTRSVAAYTATRFTTAWGGSAIAAFALLRLVIGLPFVTVNGATTLSWYQVPSAVSSVVSFVASLLLAAGVYCLGFGIRGEAGLVGDSRAGRIAVRVFVVATVASGLIRLLFGLGTDPVTVESAVVRSDVQLGLGVVALAALIVCVVVLVRRGMLNRALRWGLIIVTAWTLLIHAVSYTPFVPAEPNVTFVMVAIVAGNAYYLGLLLQVVLGAGIALHGQAAALRRRAALINERW